MSLSILSCTEHKTVVVNYMIDFLCSTVVNEEIQVLSFHKSCYKWKDEYKNCWEAMCLLGSTLPTSPAPRRQPQGACHANPCQGVS